MGSMREARRAGRNVASSATVTNDSDAPEKIPISVGLTLQSMPAITAESAWVSPRPPAPPITAPARTAGAAPERLSAVPQGPCEYQTHSGGPDRAGA
jgi:hypothetical protein